MGGGCEDVDTTQTIAGYVLTKGLSRLLTSDLTSNVRPCRGKSLPDVQKQVSTLVAGGWLAPETPPMDGRFVSYLRVSTDRQGKSGLGLDAQKEAVAKHLNGGSWTQIDEFVEVESGKDNDRPELAKALARCKLTGATLIVAKLDRLSRNQSFLMNVYEGTGDGGVVFCDLPTIPPGPVGKSLVQQMAAVAELGTRTYQPTDEGCPSQVNEEAGRLSRWQKAGRDARRRSP